MSEWRESLPEDLRSAGELQNFASVADLAKSHIEAQKTLSSRPQSISGQEPSDIFFDKAGKALGVKDDLKSYKDVGNDNISKVAMRYKIHSRQLKPFLEDIQPELDSMSKKVSEQKHSEYKRQTAMLERDYKDHDLLRAQCAKRMGRSLQSMRDNLGISMDNPIVQHMMFLIGSGNKPTPYQTEDAPKTSGGGIEDAGENIAGNTLEDLQRKAEYVHDAKQSGSPYYDKDHKDYPKMRRTVQKYVADLMVHQKKTGEDVKIF